MPLYFGFPSRCRSGCSSAARDAFQTAFPIPAPPCCQIGFHTVPGPLPVTTAMQLSPVSFEAGMRFGPVMAQNRILGELCWRWESTSPSPWENDQLTGENISTIWECGICVFGGHRVLFRGATVFGYRDSGSQLIGKACVSTTPAVCVGFKYWLLLLSFTSFMCSNK